MIGTIDGPVATIDSTTPATCEAADGSASLSPTNYVYTWDFDGNTGALRNDLPAGTYQVTVKEPGNICENIITVVIDETSPLTAVEIINSEPNCGQSNGSVTIQVSGGSDDYTYAPWGAATQTNLPSGPHTVTVTDNQTQCTTEVTFTLTDNVPNANVTITPGTAVSCAGLNDGEVIFNVDYDPGFTQPAKIEIIKDNIVYTNGNLEPGTYCIVVSDDNDCVAGQSCFEVTEPEALDIQAVSYTHLTLPTKA